MEEAFTALILGDAAVAALVGNRVHWRRQPEKQNDFPYINLSLVDEQTGYELEGEDGLTRRIIQVDCWGEKYLDAVNVKRAVRSLLSGYAGTSGAVKFNGIFVGGARDLDGDLPSGPIFGLSIDFNVVSDA